MHDRRRPSAEEWSCAMRGIRTAPHAGATSNIRPRHRAVIVVAFVAASLVPASRVSAIDCDILGTPDGEPLRGTAHGETICGKGGDDRLWGYGGSDHLYGGVGRDRLSGGLGADLLYGSDHIDSLRGGPGSDMLDGGNWRDVLRGEGGPDTLDGRDGTHSPDILRGGPGNDTCDAEENDVTISYDIVKAAGGSLSRRPAVARSLDDAISPSDRTPSLRTRRGRRASVPGS